MRKTGLMGAALAVSMLAAFALGACGSSSNGSSADNDAITTSIQAATTSGDPSACTKYQTTKFVQQTNGGGNAQAAIKSCEQDAQSSKASKVDVHDINVNGDSATAQLDWTGSFFDGQTLKVSLIKQGGVWKLDEFNGFESFDKAAFISAFPSQLPSGAPPQAVDCLKKQLESTPDQQIEDSLTSGNSGLDKIFAPCAKYFKQG